MSGFILLDITLARWRRPVASSKALDLLHRAMHAVLYWCTAAAMNMATFLGVFVVVVCLHVALAAAGAKRSK